MSDLLELENLEPRTSYKAQGEQIDGSFFLDGTVVLLEAKWHKNPIPASTLYQFKGKVDGKLVGTVGVFISMSGYSEDAIDALTLGKSLNLILFDKDDIDAVILDKHNFRDILKLKLRQAAEEGVVYFPARTSIVTQVSKGSTNIEHYHYDTVTGSVFTPKSASPTDTDLIIVCEGDSDRVVISTLAERILQSAKTNRSIKIIVAMGKITIPRVANAIWSLSPTQTLIVLDGDDDPNASVELLKKGLHFNDWISAVPNPTIEKWLGLDVTQLRRMKSQERFQRYREAAEQLDIEHLCSTDNSFEAFYKAVLGL